jgi:hypothetical protein
VCYCNFGDIFKQLSTPIKCRRNQQPTRAHLCNHHDRGRSVIPSSAVMSRAGATRSTNALRVQPQPSSPPSKSYESSSALRLSRLSQAQTSYSPVTDKRPFCCAAPPRATRCRRARLPCRARSSLIVHPLALLRRRISFALLL